MSFFCMKIIIIITAQMDGRAAEPGAVEVEMQMASSARPACCSAQQVKAAKEQKELGQCAENSLRASMQSRPLRSPSCARQAQTIAPPINPFRRLASVVAAHRPTRKPPEATIWAERTLSLSSSSLISRRNTASAVQPPRHKVR